MGCDVDEDDSPPRKGKAARSAKKAKAFQVFVGGEDDEDEDVDEEEEVEDMGQLRARAARLLFRLGKLRGSSHFARQERIIIERRRYGPASIVDLPEEDHTEKSRQQLKNRNGLRILTQEMEKWVSRKLNKKKRR